jgi:hypothetical protein
MDDLRGNVMPTEVAQEKDAQAAREEALNRVEANLLRLPAGFRPGPVTDLQRWLDLCG